MKEGKFQFCYKNIIQLLRMRNSYEENPDTVKYVQLAFVDRG